MVRGSGKRKSAEVFRKGERVRESRKRESAEGSENRVRIAAHQSSESFGALNREGLLEFNLHSAVSSSVALFSCVAIPCCVGVSSCVACLLALALHVSADHALSSVHQFSAAALQKRAPGIRKCGRCCGRSRGRQSTPRLSQHLPSRARTQRRALLFRLSSRPLAVVSCDNGILGFEYCNTLYLSKSKVWRKR